MIAMKNMPRTYGRDYGCIAQFVKARLEVCLAVVSREPVYGQHHQWNNYLPGDDVLLRKMLGQCVVHTYALRKEVVAHNAEDRPPDVEHQEVSKDVCKSLAADISHDGYL